MAGLGGLSSAAAALAAVLALAGAASGLAWAADDTIVLGAAVSLSGKFAVNGRHTKNGYDLAAAAVNAKGGVKVAGKDYKIAIKYYDDESMPARGVELVERLITEDGVKFMLGPYSSVFTKAVAPVVEKHKVVMVEGNGADRDLFVQGYRYLFAVLTTSDQYLGSAVQLLGELAKAAGRDPRTLRIAIAIENDPFSQDVRDGIIEDAKRWGMKVAIDDDLPPAMDDMSTTLAKVKALKADLLVVSGHTKGVLLAVRQVAEHKLDVPMLAATHCEPADIVANYGKAAEFWLCGIQWDRSLAYRDRWFGSAEEFAKRFEESFAYAPPYQAAEAAAALLAFADAFGRAASLEGEAVRVAVAATNMETFYGRIKYDATGKNAAKPIVLRQVQNGQFKVVAPRAWASTQAIFPAPPWSRRGGD